LQVGFELSIHIIRIRINCTGMIGRVDDFCY
jgi:hypothetical protein